MVTEIKNLPYTIVGGTGKPKPINSILLTAEGIKAIAKEVKEGEMVRIKEWCDYTEECENVKHYLRITKITKKV